MAQHDYSIVNQSGAAFRADLNNGLAAIVSNNSGATEPVTMYAYQWWPDTTTGLLKQRNSSNSAWLTVGTLASAHLGLIPAGTGAIVNADVSGTAAILHSKLANITAASVLLGNATNVPTATAVTGAVTISSSGVTVIGSGVITSTMLLDGTILDADINASAAIAGTKIAPDFGSQNVTTTGTLAAGTTAVTGAISATTGMAVGGATAGTGGVAFPATAVAVTDANTLDDYEEGTWTPDIGGTATYNGQSGHYTKVGRLVTIRCSIEINVLGTGSTNTLSGLPFTAAATGNPTAAISVSIFTNLAVSTIFLSGYAAASTTTVLFTGSAASATSNNNAIAIFGDSARVDFTSTYFV